MKQVYTDAIMLGAYLVFAAIVMLCLYQEVSAERIIIKDKYGNQKVRCYSDSKGNLKCFTN